MNTSVTTSRSSVLEGIVAQSKVREEIMAHVNSCDRVGLHLAKQRLGYGIERGLYALNSSGTCQSHLLAADYVAGLDDLLPALERLAAQGKTERPPMDWHIGGFVSARMKMTPEIGRAHV